MTLDWTFSFILASPSNPRLLLSVSYRNGTLQFIASDSRNSDIITQMESMMMLINYIAYFPNKDFVKIKLKTEESQFAVHFLDKRFLDEKLLGCFSVSESDSQNLLEFWGVEEMMAEYIFEYFWDLYQGKAEQGYDLQIFIKWLDSQISDFYLDWIEAKQSPNPISPLINANDWMEKYENWWDIQIINEYGQPVSELISFINNEGYSFDETDGHITQNLESMSLSALKILLDQQTDLWQIQYLKQKLPNSMGFQYTFFKQFTAQNVRFLLVMNTSIYDISSQSCVQIFRGKETAFMDSISGHLKLNGNLFYTNGLFANLDAEQKFHQIILRVLREIYP